MTKVSLDQNLSKGSIFPRTRIWRGEACFSNTGDSILETVELANLHHLKIVVSSQSIDATSLKETSSGKHFMFCIVVISGLSI